MSALKVQTETVTALYTGNAKAIPFPEPLRNNERPLRHEAERKQAKHAMNRAVDDMTETSRSSDNKLVQRVQRGDTTAFDMLVVKYQSKVGTVVSRYVQDMHEVQDITQEAFIKAFRAIHNFRGDSAFYTWIYRIAINCAKNHLVSRGRRPPSTDFDIDDAENAVQDLSLRTLSTPETEMQKDQLEAVVKRTLEALPEDLRLALTLREFDGLSYDEIAHVMECPVGTVRSRIFRAREALDQKIAPLMAH